MNRIKQLRIRKGLTLKELATELSKISNKTISYATISRWEKGINEPKLETWLKLSDYFDVPVSYLQGIGDDLTGWIDWEDATGYNKQELQAEIDRLEKAGYINATDDIQSKIGSAVKSLDYSSATTNQGMLKMVERELIQLKTRVTDAVVIPPKKVDMNGLKVIPSGTKTETRNGVDVEVYNQLMKLLDETRYKLPNLMRNNDN
ncbi:helix-turn-helix domain-containing protein [Limosilactobacillus equigenerosi]|nr:helix-turn-helix transcriptional regulator [Limosilactobacillus equigenerosi]